MGKASSAATLRPLDFPLMAGISARAWQSVALTASRCTTGSSATVPEDRCSWILLIDGPGRYWVLRGPAGADYVDRIASMEAEFAKREKLSAEGRGASVRLRNSASSLRATLDSSGAELAFEMKPVQLLSPA